LIVIDTHAVIWLTQDASQLSSRASEAMISQRRSGGLSIADITLREIAFLVTSGRVSVSPPLDEYLKFIQGLFKVVAISAEIARQSVMFSRKYPRDPADRLIGATALVLGVPLITADGAIRASGEVNCLW
jgi:PIN domain nuclease of toxin-antitoxin system